MAQFLGSFESNTPEWLELRKGKLGGSQVGAVLGLNPWESAVTCWYKVTGQISSDIPVSEAMMIGTELEESMFRIFANKHPEWNCDYQPGTYAHDKYAQFIANPDIIVTDPYNNQMGVVDLKYSSSFWDDAPPPHYVAQVNWYMWIMGLDFAMVAGLIGGRWREFRIERNDFAIDSMVDKALEFWGNVESLTRPEWDGSESTYETMRQVNGDVEDTGVELGDLGARLIDALSVHKESELVLTQVKSEILGVMGDAKNGLLNGSRICYRQKASNGKPFLKIS
jgi:putative phage-type endonuclease